MVDTIAGGRSATITLPLLPLPGGVVFPGMVVTIAIDSAQATAAFTAAPAAGGRLLLVPRVDDRYAAVGTVVKVEQTDRLPGGRRGRPGPRPGAGPHHHRHHGTRRRPGQRLDHLGRGHGRRRRGHRRRARRGARHRVPSAGRGHPAAPRRGPHRPGDRGDHRSRPAGRHRRCTRRTCPWSRRSMSWRPSTSSRASRRSWAGPAKRWPISRCASASRTTSPTRWSASSASTSCASSWRPSARSWPRSPATRATAMRWRTTAAARRPCPRPCARSWQGDRPASSAPASSRRSSRGSGPGSTASSSCRGASAARTASTSTEARAILDADHTGLVEVKDRIVEYLAVRKLRKERGLDGPLRLAPPPTGPRRRRSPRPPRRAPAGTVRSWPWSVRPAWARPRWASPSHGPWVASSCGSPSAACGTRPRSAATAAPTSAPSRAASPARSSEAGTMNPVMLLDEIDKVGSDWRGDPSVGAARGARPGAEPHVPRPLPRGRPRPLRRALPRRPRTSLETIPAPLLDRMEIVTPRRLHRGREGRDRPPAPAGRASSTRTGLGLDEVE